MTTKTIDKAEIRRALRKALRPSPDANYNRQHWPQWLYDRLTTLAIYGASDKINMRHTCTEALRRYSDGQDYNAIAFHMGISKDTSEKYVRIGLNWIIDHTPDYLLINIPTNHTRWRLKACPRCRGDLYLDEIEGSYYCLACGHTTEL